MGQTIEIIGEVNKNKPRTICPHCKRTVPITLDAWKEDVSRLVADKCPHCGGRVVFGLLILSDVDPKRVMNQVQAIIEMFKQAGANVLDPEKISRILQP